MLERCKQVDLDNATAGMVLSEAVFDAHGSVLLPGATVLSDANLTSLRRRGIDTIAVVNDDISEADLQAERERVQRRLSSLFRKCVDQPSCAALLQQISAYRLGDAT